MYKYKFKVLPLDIFNILTNDKHIYFQFDYVDIDGANERFKKRSEATSKDFLREMSPDSIKITQLAEHNKSIAHRENSIHKRASPNRNNVYEGYTSQNKL